MRTTIRQPLQIRVTVARKPVERGDDRHAETFQDFDVFKNIWQTSIHAAFSLIPDALNRGYENRGRRGDAGLLHDNVEILLGAEIRTEVDLIKIFQNGPMCTNAGVPSVVCARFG